jgi:hypothetical protein
LPISATLRLYVRHSEGKDCAVQTNLIALKHMPQRRFKLRIVELEAGG